MSYLENRKIDQDTQIKVIKHLEYMHELEKIGNSKSEKILNCLPLELQNEVKQDFYGRILMRCDIFRYNFSSEFIRALSLEMKEMTTSPGQDIFKQSQIEQKFFFVYQGEIEVFVKVDERDKSSSSFSVNTIRVSTRR